MGLQMTRVFERMCFIMGCWVDLEINLLRAVRIPFTFIILSFVEIVSILMMASHLFEFASMSFFSEVKVKEHAVVNSERKFL